MHALPRLLAADDLPLAERMAALLDGELYALGSGHCPIDIPETPALRLAAVLVDRPARMIAELGTAAWVWGAAAAPPARVELCVALRARTGASGTRHAGVREVVLLPGEVRVLEGRLVTSPLRTVIDLARTRDPFTTADARAVREMAALDGFSLDDCLAALDGRRNLPDRRRAATRLAAVLRQEVGAVSRR